MKQLVLVALALCVLACEDVSTSDHDADAQTGDAEGDQSAETGIDVADNLDAEIEFDAASNHDAGQAMDAADNTDAALGMDATGNLGSDTEAGPDGSGSADTDAAMDATGDPASDAAMDGAGNPDSDAESDASAEDGALTDAEPPDAALVVATHTGAIDILEVRLRNMGGAGVDGYGVQLGISFVENTTVVAPLLEESTSPIDGCKVRSLTPSQITQARGSDEGPVQITATDDSPVFPPCLFAGSGVGYICPDTGSSGVGGSLSALGAPAGTSLFTPGGSATFGAEDVGRYLRFAATGVGALNASFPIVAVVNTTTIAIATGSGVSFTLPGSASFTTLAGVGPVPGATATTFFTDNERLTVSKADSTNFQQFLANTGFPGTSGIGDGFTLGTANGKVLPTTVPTDGSAFTIGCDDAPSCGTALGSVLDIITTDAPVASSPFSFPPPATKRIHIRCTKLGAATVTVPAAYAAYLTPATSGATRIQVLFSRLNVAGATNQTDAPNTTNLSGGHAEVGFVTPSQ